MVFHYYVAIFERISVVSTVFDGTVNNNEANAVLALRAVVLSAVVKTRRRSHYVRWFYKRFFPSMSGAVVSGAIDL